MKTKRIDHIGIAVSDLEEGIKLYSEGFGWKVTEREEIPAQGVKACFLELEGQSIELLAPLDSAGSESKLAKYLEKNGPGIHHICFEVDDLQGSLNEAKDDGIELVDQAPRPGARGSQIGFLHPKSTGGSLIELCEYPGRTSH